MLFKILPFIALVGIGIKVLAGIAALNAQKKRLKAKQEGRLEQYYADREAFWRNVDRISMFAIAATVIWYIAGVLYWLSGS
jgi:hypothetical protein